MNQLVQGTPPQLCQQAADDKSETLCTSIECFILGGRTGSERLSMSKQAARFADNGIHVSVLPPLIDHYLNDIVLLAPAPAAPQSLKLTYEVPAMLRIQVKHQNVRF